MKKKLLLLLAGIACLLLIAVLIGYKKKPESEPQPQALPPAVINQLPIKDRPYVTLIPRVDGKEVVLTINGSAGADLVEYELEYQAGNMIQGAFGRIDFSQDEPPVSKELLFGSCSKGKCKYDEDVSGGSLTLRFEGEQRFVLKGDFTLQLMAETEGIFTSRDGRLSLDLGSKDLASSTYVIVANTLGLPGTIEGEVVAGPYGFFTAAKSGKLAGAVLSWQTSDDPAGLKIYGYVNGDWQEFSQNRSVEDKTISVSVDQLTTFVLVKE
ncbi:hypothetical protein KKD62_01365 [Patescibacteria group bacterium]|nr:hypothetical protein [Patescibacteria group bacterium]MBU1931655.1 hypothetical protein [Patescibacteria group bacterium]